MKTFWGFLRLVYVISKYRIFDDFVKAKSSLITRFFYRTLVIIFCPLKSSGNLIDALKELGPIYIKFGQTLSTRPDIIGQKACEDLRELQDRLDPFPFEELKQIFYQETGKTLEEVFSSFQQESVAAASVAQAHKAVLHCGGVVAVKVLRPDIKAKCTQDLKILNFLVRIILRSYPKTNNFKLLEVLKIFEDSMKMELNLRMEGANSSELKDNLSHDARIYIPPVYWDLTTEKVLVTKWVDGISIYDARSIRAAGLDPIEISKRVAIMFFEQTYRDGFFHADMHPGNIFVTSEGQIALVDFGIMGRLATRDRISVAQILQGFLRRDYMQVAKVHLKAGYIPKDTDLALFAGYCRSICEPIVGLALKDVAISKILGQLFQVIQEFGLDIQPQLILLQKSMILIEGVGKILNPDINMWELAYPWMEKWTIKNLGFEAKIVSFISKIKQSIEKHICEEFS